MTFVQVMSLVSTCVLALLAGFAALMLVRIGRSVENLVTHARLVAEQLAERQQQVDADLAARQDEVDTDLAARQADIDTR